MGSSIPGGGHDDAARGTVFEVSHGSVCSTWIVSQSEPPHLIQYARITPQANAGLITVACTPDQSDTATLVSVEYSLTALTEEGVLDLARFAAHYAGFIAQWRSAIASLYESGG